MEPDPVPVGRTTSSRGPGIRPGLSVFLLIVLCACSLAACASEQATSCPGQFDPSSLSDAELERGDIGRVPERGATDREAVTETIALRRAWLDQNYSAVESVEPGEGWGVTQTRDELGNITFGREPDHIIVATVAERSDCPDPDKGTLLIFSPDKKRVPVRFEYRSS